MNILVENIASSADEDQLRNLFGAFGTVESVYFVEDKLMGIRNGQAYVLMPSDDEAERAIEALNGNEFEGQQLRVKQAEQAEFPSGDFW
jgi:RNA recognition motif-containing protein